MAKGEKNIALLMIDLSGYTALTEAHGGLSAFNTVNTFEETVKLALEGGSEIVERVGDEIMVSSPNSIDVALSALKFQKLARKKSNFLLMHASMHFGKIFEKDNKLYGSTLNKTARILAMAKTDEILCSYEFVKSLPETTPLNLEELGSFTFKNILTDTKIYKLLPNAQDKRLSPVVDPVCKMLLNKDQKKYKSTYDSIVYSFCSSNCKAIFEKTPEKFI